MTRLLSLSLALMLCAAPAFAGTIHIGVDGMVCAFCAKGIEKVFKTQPETDSVQVDMNDKLITLNTKNGTTISDEKITQLITDAGYKVTTIHHQDK